MSMVSKNPFDILGDDGDSPSPAPAPKAAAPAPAAAPARAVPGSQQASRGNNTRGGRGGARGAPRNNGPRPDRAQQNTGPAPADGSAEETITAGGFDGERLPPSRKAHHGQDAHTKGPRGSRPARGGDRQPRGSAKTPAQGGERRQFERRSGAYEDSQKKVDAGWGADEGQAELTAEVEGEKDAQAEEAAPGTPVEPATEAAPAVEATPEEPEEVTKSYEEYLAERNAQALADGLGKKEGRKVEGESVEGKAFRREAMDEFFAGKQEKEAAAKTKAPKKEKIVLPFEGKFAPPARAPRPEGERGERGGDRGGRGRGGPRGGRGAPGGARGRGAPRGGRGGFGGPAPVDANDEKAFPALGA